MNLPKNKLYRFTVLVSIFIFLFFFVTSLSYSISVGKPTIVYRPFTNFIRAVTTSIEDRTIVDKAHITALLIAIIINLFSAFLYTVFVDSKSDQEIKKRLTTLEEFHGIVSGE